MAASEAMEHDPVHRRRTVPRCLLSGADHLGLAEAEGIAPDIARLTNLFRQADPATMLTNVIARASMDRDDKVTDRGKVPAH